jgi:integrase
MGCIWKRGKVYWIKYRRNGKSYYESTHLKVGDENRKSAERLLRDREGDIAKGMPITSKIGQLRYEETITDLVNLHKLRGRDTKKLEGRIKNHLKPVFSKRRLSDITMADLNAYAVARQKEGAKNGTINRELALFRSAYHRARDAGKLLHIPKFPQLKESAPRSGFFDDEQIASVIKHLPAHLKGVVRFGYITGWRVSEILKLEWRQVDMKAGEVRLDPGTTKNGDGRVFTFTVELRELLKKLCVEHDALKKQGTIGRFVFHRDGTPNLRIKSLRKPWATACKKAGVPGRLFHDLRRSAARNFVRAGIPERTAMDLLGHKTRSIFDRYNIVNDGDRRDAAPSSTLSVEDNHERNRPMVWWA